MTDHDAAEIVPPARDHGGRLERADVDLRGVLAAGIALWLVALVVLAILDAAGVGVPRLSPAVCALGAGAGAVAYGVESARRRRA